MTSIKFVPPNRFPLSIPLYGVHVNGAGTSDYTKMDRAAARRGYTAVFASGWIPTMGDQYHDPQAYVNQLNRAAAYAKSLGLDFIVGFCQTGHFSVGWTIYAKPKPGIKFEEML